MFRSLYDPRLGDEEADLPASGLVTRLKSWTVERRRQRLQRDAFNTLLRVDGHILADVTGLTREQVEHAARLPLSVDATQVIRLIQADAWRRR
ncbi:MAG: hypothetical protein V7704_10575 [Aurantimonas endophytica]|uniref:Uncharacterized protein YjiS (DUF1127 family) n=1 Tax=Aurantimonas endophytica TaxID=1522175 RepID=A0A7W6HHG7_9HYPH|nr:hypothetical protein [Aurantimonas endophytica]MBB4005350.1 uncharacterized protein YjiS (DUF1127 family) [Aurantimonas endophytica]MCO6405989.1 hypothetical protein [Aurantimonas endophytica]